MKHLKVFENMNKEFWLINYFIKYDNNNNFFLFPDEKSARNYIIEIINEERESMDADYSDDDFFTDYDEAIEWYNSAFGDIQITYEKIFLSDKYDGTEKFKLFSRTRKYNI